MDKIPLNSAVRSIEKGPAEGEGYPSDRKISLFLWTQGRQIIWHSSVDVHRGKLELVFAGIVALGGGGHP
jgi:hypothetical protein